MLPTATKKFGSHTYDLYSQHTSLSDAKQENTVSPVLDIQRPRSYIRVFRFITLCGQM